MKPLDLPFKIEISFLLFRYSRIPDEEKLEQRRLEEERKRQQREEERKQLEELLRNSQELDVSLFPVVFLHILFFFKISAISNFVFLIITRFRKIRK